MIFAMSASSTKRTFQRAQSMSAFGGKADIVLTRLDVRFCPKADISGLELLLRKLSPEPHFAGRGVGGPIQPGNQPVADRGAEPFDRGFVEDQPYGGFRQLFAIAQEHAALAEEPYRTNRNRALVGVRQGAADEIGGKSQEWCGLLSDQATKYRGRLHGFPIQDTHMAAVFVAPQQRLQLSANKLRQRFLP